MTLLNKDEVKLIKKLVRTCLCWLAVLGYSASLYANPVLDTVVSGNVSVQQTPTQTTVNQTSQQAIIRWDSFNINHNEATHFQQPAGGVALNRINPAQGPSSIYGRLTATGQIILVNPAGIFFGPTAYVNVGGLIASTADISDQNFLNGNYHFQGSAMDGPVINQGTIIAMNHGLVALLGNGVRNDGYIEATLGQVVLASGTAFTMQFNGNDMISFKVDEKGTAGITNTGTISANGGKVLVTAKAAQGVLDNVINMDGIVEARSIAEQDGTIIISGDENAGLISLAGELHATSLTGIGGNVTVTGYNILLADHSVIDVSGKLGGGNVLIGGDYQGQGSLPHANAVVMQAGASIFANAVQAGNGGKVILWSDLVTRANGSISAQGGSDSGNGGLVETSTKGTLYVGNIQVNTKAAHGKTGLWLIDPTDITLSNAADTNTSQTVNLFQPTDGALATSNINITNLVSQLDTTDVLVTTTPASGSGGAGNGDITVVDPITWSGNTTLTLDALNDIFINADINATAGSLILTAGNAISINNPIILDGTFSATGDTLNLADNITTGGNQTYSLSNIINLTASVQLQSIVGDIVIALGTSGLDGGGFDLTIDTVSALSNSSIDTSISNLNQLNKNGAGNLSLTVANTYTGLTVINAGSLIVFDNNSLGDNTASLEITSNGTLVLSNFSLTLQQAMLLDNGATISTANDFSTHSLSGAQTWSGAINLSVSNGAQIYFDGVVTGVSTLTINKSGAGQLIFTQPNTLDPSANVANINDGVLILANNDALGAPGGGFSMTINLASTATLQLFGSSINAPYDVVLSDGAAILDASTAGDNTLSGHLTFGTGNTVTITDAIGSLTFSGLVSGNSAVTLTKLGDGLLIMNNTTDGTFAGTFTAQVGQVRVTNSSALGGSGMQVDVVSGAAVHLLGTALTLSNNFTLNGTGIGGTGALIDDSTGSTTNTISGNITLGSDDGLIGVTNSGTTLILSGVIDDGASSFSFSKNGNGILQLSGTNTFGNATNGVTVTAGQVTAANNSAFGVTTAPVVVNSGAAVAVSGSGLNIANGITLTGAGSGAGALFNASGSNTWSGTIAMSGNSSFGATGSDVFTLSGAVSGGFNFTKVGTGVIELNTTNSYTGTTLVSAGTLRITNVNGLGNAGTHTSGVTVSSGATLALSNIAIAPTLTLSLNGTGAGSVGALSATGTSTWNGNITFAGDSTIASAGSLTLNGTLNNAVNLTLSGAGSITLASTVGNSSALTTITSNVNLNVNGATVTTTGAQTYNNPIDLGAGTTFTTTSNGATTFAAITNATAQALTISTGSGAISLTGNVGSATALGAINLNSTGTTTITGTVAAASLTTNTGGTTALNTTSIATSGTQTYNDNVTLGANPSVSTTGGVLTFNGSVVGVTNILTINGGTTTFNGNVNLQDLVVTAGPYAVLLNGSSSTFTDNVAFNASNGIFLGNGGGDTLTFNGGFSSTIGSTSFNGTIITSGDAVSTGTTDILGNSSITTSGGSITLGQTNGAFDLSLDSGAGTISLGNVGNNTPLVNFSATTTAALALANSITATNAINLTSGGAITGAGILSTTGTLTVSSVGGFSKTGANTVSNFNATNTTSGDISFVNTAAPLTITGITQSGGGNISVSNTGGLTINGAVTGGTGTVSLASTTAIVNVNAGISTTNNTITVSGISITQASGITTNSGSGTLNYIASLGTLTLNNGSLLLSTGTINLIQNLISFNAAAQIGGTGVGTGFATRTIIIPVTIGRTIGVADGATGALSLSTNALATIRSTNVRIGDSAISGAMQVAAWTPSANFATSGVLTLAANGGITQTGVLNLATSGANLLIRQANAANTVLLTQNNILSNVAANVNGAISISSDSALTVASLTDDIGTVNGIATTNDNVTLVVNSTIGESVGAIINGATLTTTSVGGTALGNANTVTGFNASNTSVGAITLTNTATTLAITGITQSAGDVVTVNNTGAIDITGSVVGTSPAITFTASTTLSESGAGLINTSSFVGSSNGGMTLNGANTITNFNGTNVGGTGLSLTNTGALNITGISQTGGGGLVIANTGAITQSGAITASSTSSFSAGSNSITLGNTSNFLNGAVTVSNSGATNDVTIYDSTALQMAASTVGRNLILTTEVNLTQSGILASSNGGTLTAKTLAASGNISLSSFANEFATIDLRSRNSTDTANAAGTISYRDATGFDVSNISTTNTISLTSGAAITDSGAITGSTLTLNTVGGAVLDFGDTVTGFNATNTGGGAITLVNTAAPLTITGISQTGSGAITVNNTGNMSITGSIAGAANAVNLTSTGALSESGAGLISTTDTLTTSSATGTTLSGANAVTTFNATNSTSGVISLINTIATLGITGISQTGGGAVTINNTGNVSLSGTVAGGTSAVNLTASGSLSETGAGLISTSNTLTTSSVTGTTLTGAGTNAFSTLNASNSGAGVINIANTAALTISGISQTGTGAVTVNNTGTIGITGTIAGGAANAVNLTSSGVISETGVGLISTGSTLTTTSVGGLTLGGANAVSAFNATNTGGGAISLVNTAAPLTINAITQTGVGAVSINNTGAIVNAGALNANASNNVTLTSTGTISESGSGSFIIGATLITSSVGGTELLDLGVNQVTGFTATNTTSGNIRLINLGTLSTNAITNTAPGAAVAINNTGDTTITGNINSVGQIVMLILGSTSTLTVNGDVTSSASDITYNADHMTLVGNSTASTGTVNFAPTTVLTTTTDLGGADAPGVLGLTNAELNTAFANLLRVYGNNTLTISSAINILNATSFRLYSSGVITQAASVTATNLVVSSVGATALDTVANNVSSLTASVSGSASAFNFRNAGALSIIDNDFVTGVSTNNGAISITTDTGGISVAASTNVSTGGTADLTLNSNAGTLTLNANSRLLSTGTITLTQDNMTIDAAAQIGGSAASTGTAATTLITPSTTGRTIGLAGGTGNLSLTASELATIRSTNVRIGSTTSGAMDIGAWTPTADFATGVLTLAANGAITQSGAINLATSTADLIIRHLDAASTVDLTQNNSFGNIAATVSGALSLTSTSALVITSLTDDLGTVSGITTTNDNITLSSGGTITNTVGNIINGAALTTSSVGGTVLDNAHTVTTFNATNTGGGAITLFNTAAPLTITGVSQTGSGAVTINNTGAIDITGSLAAGTGNAINLTSSGTITDNGAGLVSGGTLTTVSTGGTILDGANAVTGFNATNATSGDITLVNTAATLTVSGVTQSSGAGNATITNTGNLTTTGAIATRSGNVSLTTLSPDAFERILTVGIAGIQSGVGAVTGGAITLTSANNAAGDATALIVNGVLDSTTGSGGILTLSGGVAINASPLIGAGNVTLNGNGIDISLGAINFNTSTVISVIRHINVTGALSTSAGMNLTLNGDNDNDGVGGVIVQAGGSVTSGGTLIISGSDFEIGNPFGADPNAAIELVTGSSISATGAVSLNGNIGNSNILVNGSVTAGGAGDVDINPAGTGRIVLGNNVTTSTGNINVTANADLSANSVLTTSNGAVTFAGTVDGAHNLTVAAGTGVVTFTGDVGLTTALGALQSTGSGNVIFGGSVGDSTHVLTSVAITGNSTLNGSTVFTSGAQNYAALTLATTTELNSSGGDIIIAGALDGGASALTINNAGASSAISGDITNLTNLFKNGVGTLTLSGNNAAYSGTTRINAGTLQIGVASDGLGSGLLEFNGGNLQSSIVSPFNAILNNNYSVLATSQITGTNTFSLNGVGTLFSGATLNITKTGVTSINSLTGNGNFGISGGQVNLLTTSTYSGSTDITNGTLFIFANNILPDTTDINITGTGGFNLNGFNETINSLAGTSGSIILSGGATLTTGSTGDTTFSGTLNSGGNLIKQGTGTFTLAGTNSMTGTITINAGILNVTSAGGLGVGIFFPSLVTVANGAALSLTTSTMSASPTSLHLNGTGIASNGALIANNSLTYAGAITLDTASSINVVGGATTLILSGAIDGASGIDKIGAGTLHFSNTGNSYAGATTITAGTLTLDASGVIPNASDVSVNGGSIFNLAGFSETIGNLSGAGSVTLNGGSLTTGTASNSTFSGVISLTGNLIKQGAGILTLSGVNTFTGTATINAGTLQVGVTNALPTTAAVTLANTAGAVFDLNGFDTTIGSLTGGGGTGGNVLLGANTLTINNASNTTFSGSMTGTGNLTKQGTGTLIIDGNSAYTGTTNIDAGTLQFATNPATTSVNVTSGAALSLVSASLTSLINLNGSGISSTGALIASGVSAITGGITLGNSATSISSAGTLTLSGIISGAGASSGIASIGTGTLVLSSANTFQGAVTIANNGTVVAGNANALGGTGTGTTVSSNGILRLTVPGIVEPLTLNNGALDSVGNTSLTGILTLLTGTTNSITSTGGTFTMVGAVDGNGALTLQGTGGINLTGLIGGTTRLSSLNVTATNTTINTSQVRTTGNQTFANALALTSNIGFDSTSGAVTFNGTIDGGFDMTVVGATAAFNAGVGATPLNSLSVTANTITLNGSSVATAANQTYTGSVVLGSTTTLTSNTGNIAFTNGISGGQDLALNGGGVGTHTFSIAGALSVNNITMTAGVGSTNNILSVDTGGTQNWSVTATNGGSLTGVSGVGGAFTFSNFAFLDGSSGNDNFALSGGTLGGGLNGMGGTNSLTGNNVVSSWGITGANTGTVTGIGGGFLNIQNLVGGNANNTFTFADGGSVTSINGGNLANTNILDYGSVTSAVTIFLSSTFVGTTQDGSSATLNTFTNINQVNGDYVNDEIDISAKVFTVVETAYRQGYIDDPLFYFGWLVAGSTPPVPPTPPTPGGGPFIYVPPIIQQPIINHDPIIGPNLPGDTDYSYNPGTTGNLQDIIDAVSGSDSSTFSSIVINPTCFSLAP